MTAAVVVADEMRETTIVMDAEAIARETTIGEDAEVGLPIRRPLIDWQTAEIIEEAGTTIAVVVVGETTIVGMLAEAVEELDGLAGAPRQALIVGQKVHNLRQRHVHVQLAARHHLRSMHH